MKELINQGRNFLKANWHNLEGTATDQMRGVPAPEKQKPVPEGASVIKLIPREELEPNAVPLYEAIENRRSRRRFKKDPVSLDDLSYLLWATQGVKREGAHYTLRPVPSAGARHSFETYLCILRCEGLEPGLYRYLPLDHGLVNLPERQPEKDRIAEGLLGQTFGAAAVFIWTAVPYRMEWRYSAVSHKIIAIDAGHLCQNLYLAVEAVECGTCAIGAYNQQVMDEIVGADGEEEFVIYAAPVGKV
jgi:SagB-type dehydrogenase family enzyme